MEQSYLSDSGEDEQNGESQDLNVTEDTRKSISDDGEVGELEGLNESYENVERSLNEADEGEEPDESQDLYSTENVESGRSLNEGEEGEELVESQDLYSSENTGKSINDGEYGEEGEEDEELNESQDLYFAENAGKSINDEEYGEEGEELNESQDLYSTENAKKSTNDVEYGEEGEEVEELNESHDLNTTENVGKLMANIFGDENYSDEEEQNAQIDQPEQSASVVAGNSDEELGPIREWDFDKMMLRKRAERKRQRRRKDTSYDLISDADDVIKALVDGMNEAANDDRVSNIERRPATRKLLMLPEVRKILIKANLLDAMIDNGMISAISEWLAPLPDKSLPALEIRTTLLNILEGFALESGILKQSGIGKAVMFLQKHPKENKKNKAIAARLIREWSRPIFQLDIDYRSLSREERVQRDYNQVPEAKRRRIRVDGDGLPMPSSSPRRHGPESDQQPSITPSPKDSPSSIPRARVPKPSTRDYVVRPKSEIEGTFRGATKKQSSVYDRKLREFKDRNKRNMHALNVSIGGQKS